MPLVKITCPCGGVIADNTDFISRKGYLVADQDYFDLQEDLESEDRVRRRDALRRWERLLYQCPDCGRLLVESREHQHTYVSFTPDDAAAAVGILRSKEGPRWRGVLIGLWGPGSLSDKGGTIYWHCGDGESGSEEFGRWEEQEARYHDLFRTLRRRDVLRSAFLRKNAETVHAWP